ncbi:MAG: response regulator transcription factor [Chloroflexota bacterium]
MERLRQRDFLAVLRFLHEVYAIQEVERFPEQVGSALGTLVANDYFMYAEVDLQTRKTVFATSQPPLDSLVPNFPEVFERVGHENPLLTAHQGHPGALKISDFLSQRQLLRLPLYNEFFRPGGVHYQMSVVLPAKQGILRGIVVNRGTRDFSERERFLLDLVRLHLVQARQNAEILDSRRRALEVAGHEIICLSGDRRVTYLSGGASSLAADYFGASVRRDNRLPNDLDGWVKEQQGCFHGTSDNLPTPRLLVEDRGDKRLVIRFIHGGGGKQDDMLLLNERTVQVSPESLAAIGLSRREAEVLSLVIQGRSVTQISRILVVTTSTVEKHLENIYLKLGVHSRGAAIARALDAVKAWR